MKFHINVTQECIDKGKKRDYKFCPIALAAVKDGIPELRVGKTTMTICCNYEHRLVLPDTARDFISKFDQGEAVKPFEFDIEVPDEG